MSVLKIKTSLASPSFVAAGVMAIACAGLSSYADNTPLNSRVPVENWAGQGSSSNVLSQELAAFESDPSDDAAWARLERVGTTAGLPEVELASTLYGMADSKSVSRFKTVRRGVADRFASQDLGPWIVAPDRFRNLCNAVAEFSGDRELDTLSANERALIKAHLPYIIELHSLPIYQRRASRLVSWPGWTTDEVRVFAMLYLSATNYEGSVDSPKILGRVDDRLEPELYAHAVLRWGNDRAIARHPLAVLVYRGDKNVGPLLRQIRADIQADGNCGLRPCVEMLVQVDGFLEVDRIMQADVSTLIEMNEGDLASIRGGPSNQDSLRLLVVRRLIELGVPKSTIRESFYKFVGKLALGTPIGQPWSRLRSDLVVVKANMVRYGVLDKDADLPDVPFYPTGALGGSR